MAKKQAENTETQAQTQAKYPNNRTAEITEGTKIRAIGPKDRYNGAQILRHKKEDNSYLDIQAGMILEVGSQITSDEADRFLNLRNWSFERVGE